MKKILIFILGIVIFQSCTVVPSPEKHFINEDFILIKKYEKDIVVNGYTRTIRTWEIAKIENDSDSITVGLINNEGDYTSCSTSIITDELWNSRKVGTILHFDYIMKDRFHKEKRIVEEYDFNIPAQEYSEPSTITSDELVDVKVSAINMNSLEVERRILELEREIDNIERQIETLKLNL